jgi:transketolase
MSHIQALRRIGLLERELERSDVAVAEAISETFKAREQVKELEVKLRAYEKRAPALELNLDRRVADDWRAVLQADTEALKRQLAEAQGERDAALQVVEEIKRLMMSRGCSL